MRSKAHHFDYSDLIVKQEVLLNMQWYTGSSNDLFTYATS